MSKPTWGDEFDDITRDDWVDIAKDVLRELGGAIIFFAFLAAWSILALCM